MEAIDRIKKIIIDQLGIEEGKISIESSFIDDLGADSLDTIELVMVLEDKFGIEISDEDTEKILAVSDVVKYIESKINPA